MQTTVKELPDSRVEVEVEVPAETSKAASSAPPAASLARCGCPASARARRRRRWSSSGSASTPCSRRRSATRCPSGTNRRCSTLGVSPVGDPDIEIVSSPEDEGEPLSFKFEVGVRPEAELGEYKGLEVGRAETEVRRGDRRPPRSSGCARASPGSSRSTRRGRGRRAADRLRGPARRQGLRGRQGRATTCWSSAAAA